MASILDQILLTLVARLAAIPQWDVQLRTGANAADAAVRATVFHISEDKDFANNEFYNCTLRVGVSIIVRMEDADPVLDVGTDGEPNPYRYFDRMRVLAEKKIHEPDSWGFDPDFTDVKINGHEVDNPSEKNELEGLMRLTFTYRHSITSPEE